VAALSSSQLKAYQVIGPGGPESIAAEASEASKNKS